MKVCNATRDRIAERDEVRFTEADKMAFRKAFLGMRVPDLSEHSTIEEMEWKDLVQTRSQLKKATGDLLDRAKQNDRGFTEDEERAFDAAIKFVEGISTEMDARDELGNREAGVLNRPMMRATEDPSRIIRAGRDYDDRDTSGEVRFLKPEERMRDFVTPREDIPEISRIGFGRYIRAMTVGPQNEAERRALAEGTDSAGGFTVPDILGTELIDRMRSKATIMKAGAMTVGMESDTLNIARQATDPVPAWRVENALVNESDATFERVQFVARSLAVLVKVSRELLEDSVNISQAMMNAFSQSMGLEVDRVALLGTGVAPQPAGINVVSGVGSVSLGVNGAQLTNYDPLLDGLSALMTANAEDPTCMIMAPRTATTINKMKDTTNQPLRRPQALENVPFYATTQVPITQTQGTANNASSIFTGNFREMMVGVRTSLRVEVIRERYAEYLQYAYLVHLRCDIQLAHPASFAKIIGIIP